VARAAARGRRSRVKKEASSGRVLKECAGVALLGASLLAALALATYSQTDPVLERAAVTNRAGMVGALVAALLLRGLGYGSVILVAATAFIGVRLILGKPLPPLSSRFWVAALLLLVSVATLGPILHESFPGRIPALEGGAVGGFLARREAWLVGAWGALLLNAVLFTIGCLSATGISTGSALTAVGLGLGWAAAGIAATAVNLGSAIRAIASGVRNGVAALASGVQRGFRAVVVWRERRARRARVAAVREAAIGEELPAEEDGASDALASPRSGVRRARGAAPTIIDHQAERSLARTEHQEAFRFAESGLEEPFQLPDPAAVFQTSTEVRSYDRESLIMNSRILEKKLQDFGVLGKVVTVHPGPVVTMYEFEPGSGIKVNKIVGLADDLALALRALSVRVEVANQQRETVYIHEVLEAESLRSNPSKLAIALGKDIFGNPAHADLGKMPHLLIAGATGTGKSVFLNSLLCSLLCRATPHELKLLLIDPKLLELSIYEGIPHLLADVVTNPKRAAAVSCTRWRSATR